jgi:uncharacterized delta-60 repeat protein
MKMPSVRLVTLCLICTILQIFAQRTRGEGGVPLWTNRYNGPGNGTDVAIGVGVDAAGNIFVTGYSANSLNPDYLTIAYSSSGVPLWTNRYDRQADGDQASNLSMDANGNIIVTGFGNAPTTFADFVTIKYSNAGVPLWTNIYNNFPENSGDSPTAMAVDSSGNVFVTGRSFHSGGVNSDYATVAYSSTGVPLWTNRYDDPVNGADVPTGLAVDNIGNVFVTGSSSSGTSADYLTIKYSPAGIPLWTNRYNGAANGNDQASGIAVATNGNVFVTGSSSNSGTYSDITTIAYSNSGNPLWTNSYNGPANTNDFPNAIAVAPNGNVIVTGYSFNSANDSDFVTIAYSAGGTPLWTNRYNGTANGADRANCIAVDQNGNVFVSGSAAGTGSSLDCATVAYSSVGVPLWTNLYNGPANGVDNVAKGSITVDRVGNVIIVGQSAAPSGLYDYVTIKYSATLPSVRLAFQNINNRLVLTWADPGFALQSAPALAGTFTNIPGATSPYTNLLTGPAGYFRLKSN